MIVQIAEQSSGFQVGKHAAISATGLSTSFGADHPVLPKKPPPAKSKEVAAVFFSLISAYLSAMVQEIPQKVILWGIYNKRERLFTKARFFYKI